MTAYTVYGDISPWMIVHVDDDEYKTLRTKISIGIAPEDIHLKRKPVNGRRELSVFDGFSVIGKGDYMIVSKGHYLYLKLKDQEEIPF